jgi:hypothetical protein
MVADQNNDDELNARRGEFAKNLICGLLAFAVTFAVLTLVLNVIHAR